MPDPAKAFNLEQPEGDIIDRSLRDGPGAEESLRIGDIIQLQINSRMHLLLLLVWKHRPGG